MGDSSVLMFSGGRDSTLSAIRLARTGRRLILVTVTSQHLEGISAVKQRIVELRGYLSKGSRWISIPDTNINVPFLLNYSTRTCLPCFLKYTSIGVIIAKKFNINSLSFGFTHYQSGWPEQTPLAIEKFKKTLNQFGLNLDIPVYDLESKEKAIEELRTIGINSGALEQKCSRQIINEEIPLDIFEKAINEWAEALSLTILANLELDPVIAEIRHLDRST